MATHAGVDPALDTLLLPLLDARLPWPASGGLFLRARHTGVLDPRRWPGMVCEQSFKPHADELQRAGFEVASREDLAAGQRRFDLLLVLPPRQRDEARALLSLAVRLAQPGGRVLACLPNNEGARSGEADLARIAGPLETMTKNKCRVYWTQPLQSIPDAQLLQEWAQLDRPRAIQEPGFVSRPGLFAWDRIDPASAILASCLPADLSGAAADVGAGFGYLTARLLDRCAGVRSVDVIEAEARALELARINLRGHANRADLRFHWLDATRDLPGHYDLIVTNPPFHAQHGSDRPDIGRAVIASAGRALVPGGRLWLVANRHLPYEAALGATFGSVRTVVQQHGYKVIEAVRNAKGAGVSR